MARTKIVCTIGPACNTVDRLIELIEAGMSVARLNFSHGTHEEHAETISRIKEARDTTGQPVAIMLDTKGPEIRLGPVTGDGVYVRERDRIRLVAEQLEGNAERISVLPGFVLKDWMVGHRILLNDGYISARVVEAGEDEVVIECLNAGHITTGRSVNCPDSTVDLPAMTDRDIRDIRFGCQQDVDIIAASFIRSPEHVLSIRRLLEEEGQPGILIVSKIENHEGVDNFDTILQVSNGIMIARGDLGVEVPLSQVPKLQKMMIRRCYLAGKASVTATQMLESMIQHPRPTRAEVSDVANAIYDSTSAVMLSAETAVGKYPIEAVRTMGQIIDEAEKDFDYETFFKQHARHPYNDVPSSVTLAAVQTAYSSHAKAIFGFTRTGGTARLLSRLRPEMPIIALTPIRKAFHQLALNWGVHPVFAPEIGSLEEAFEKASAFALERKWVQYGDLVIVTAGSPFGITGTTNTMLVENIGDVLVRGHSGHGQRVYGKVHVVFTPEEVKPYHVRDQLLCLTQSNDAYLPLIRQARGVILQNHVDDKESERHVQMVARTLDIPTVVRADGACTVLQTGQLVTMDPERALVYKGVFLDEEPESPSSSAGASC